MSTNDLHFSTTMKINLKQLKKDKEIFCLNIKTIINELLKKMNLKEILISCRKEDRQSKIYFLTKVKCDKSD